MRRFRVFLLRLAGLFTKEQRDRELAEELESHLQMHVEDNLRRGMTPEEARRQALLKLGGVEATKEMYRERRSLPLVEAFFRDFRYGGRMLHKNPGFTLAVVLTLSLGIGATTAIFGLVNAVLLRPLPFHEPDRLVLAFNTIPAAGVKNFPFSQPEYLEHRSNNEAFEQVAVYTPSSLNLTGEGDPQRVAGARVSANFFELLGVPMALGRGFSPEADQPRGERQVILGYGFWLRQFGGVPSRVGTTVRIDGVPHTIAAVLPPGTQFPLEAELWVPAVFSPQASGADGLGNQAYRLVGRLKPTVSLQQAAALTRTTAEPFYARYPRFYSGSPWRIELFPLQEYLVGDAGWMLWMLLGAVGFVLLLCCANVANLLLSRFVVRRQEFSMRAALGASSGRLFSMALTESLLLGLLGGGAGLLLAYFSLDLFKTLSPVDIPRAGEVNVDMRVFMFALLVSALGSVFFGLAPAWMAGRLDLMKTLRAGGPRGGGRKSRLQGALVVAEIALAFVLLVGGGLFMRSLIRLAQVDPGFQTGNRLAMQMTPPASRYPDQTRVSNLFRDIVERAAALPGVQAAGGVSSLPLSGSDNRGAFQIEHWTPEQVAKATSVHFRYVTPGYFQAIGIPLVRGRLLTDADGLSAPRSAVVNASFSRLFWPQGDPIGHRLSFSGEQGPWYTIVGVVGDVKHSSLSSSPLIEVYVSYEQAAPWRMQTMTLVVQAGNTASAVKAVRGRISEIDPDLPVFNVRTLVEVVGASMGRQRFQVVLMSSFALCALALAAVGIYGVISFSVAQRTREIGIRMALGARRHDVLGLILGQGLRLALAGLVIGLLAALYLSRFLESMLFEVEPHDPMIFAALAVLLGGVSLLACYVPSQRATAVDPVVALRYE